MDLNFKEFLELLNRFQVKYVIVGAYALGCYVEPRFTNDMDIFVKPDAKNTERLANVLREFGFNTDTIDWKLFINGEEMIRLGNPPIRIDIMSKISGVSWPDVWKNKFKGIIDNARLPAFFIGKKQFIKNKLASGRPKDLIDAKLLME